MMNRTHIRQFAVVLAALSLALGAQPAMAQAYPAKPIRLILPLSTGSTGDVVARILSGPMGKALGQPLVVENLPGAGGVTGTQQLVRAPKDGYTIAVITNNHVINPSIYKSIPYDTLKDITPITVIGNSPLVLVVNPGVAAKNTQELIALAKARPGALNYGSAGNGTVLHLAGVLFATEAGIDIRHVPYKGTGPLVNDLLGGQVEMGIVGLPSVVGQVKSGRLRAIGVTTAKRAAVMPEIPTLAESGLPNYNFEAWIAFVGAAGLPQAIVDRIYAETKAALALKEVQDAFAAQGLVVVASTPEHTAQFFQSELDKHTKLVKKSGAALD
jgi:tripartite-type tricarboxylate transporter receptor subunit TctC